MGGTFDKCDEKINRMLDRQETWSMAHNSPAEITKFKCVQFTHHADTSHPDFVCEGTGTVIKCSDSACLLGVEVDQELHWHHHVQLAIQKGEVLLHAANRLTRPSFGLPARHVRKIYMAIVLLKVKYAMPVWYTPVCSATSTAHTAGSVRHMHEIEKVQRLACRLMMGAFKSTATDVLELHTNIPPTALHLEDSCYREALCVCSLLKPHPLTGPAHRAASASPCFHCSPLHMLLQGFNLWPRTIEVIDNIAVHPNWVLLVTTHIAADKDDAAQHICMWLDEVKVFSNGSGLSGHVGAAAMVVSLHGGRHLQFQLGSDTVHTVFEVELTGILLTVHLICDYPCTKTALITVDNQAAIATLTNQLQQPEQYLVNEIHVALRVLQQVQPRMRVHIEWVPGHANVPGSK